MNIFSLTKAKPFLKILIFILLITSPALQACTIPVFRYALENWRADAYAVTITHSGPLTGQAKAAADLLESYIKSEQTPVNLNVRYTDTQKTPPKSTDTAAEQKPDSDEPQMAVYFPRTTRIQKPIWQVPLTEQAVRQLLDSPLRRKISKLLLDGESSVWILLEIGDEKKDNAAAELIGQQLKHLQSTLKLPQDPAFEDGTAYSDTGFPLKIAFSLLRLKRDDPREQFLVRSLLRTEYDLLTFDEPLAFPVFGRGIILYALVGKGITAANIYRGCSFIVGACSCIVKAQNPGVDMLLAVGWDTMLTSLPRIDEPSPPLTGVFPISIQEEPNVSTASIVKEVNEPTTELPLLQTDSEPSKNSFNIIGTVIFVLVTIIIFVVIVGMIVTQHSKRARKQH